MVRAGPRRRSPHPRQRRPRRYEGVQDDVAHDRRYWHPDQGGTDDWIDAGFPTFDGLLADALASFEAEALAVPWWPAYGNHDGLLQGNAAPHPSYDDILVGDRKIVDLPDGTDHNAFVATLLTDPRTVADRLRGRTYVTREVTADEGRRSITRTDWIDRMLASPSGTHGYVDDDRDATKTWYRFPLADGVVGICLDTCAHGGSASGCITEGQLRWLEAELAAVHSTHLGPDGSVVRTGADDQLVVVFSHHTSGTMDADGADPAFPTERQVQGPELVATLLRHPNVVAWVNGHTHVHEVHVHPHPQGLTPGFWEVTTASHIDFPQQSRVLELVDNADGTHSLFGVVVDHDGPLHADAGDRSLAGLVAISRGCRPTTARATPGPSRTRACSTSSWCGRPRSSGAARSPRPPPRRPSPRRPTWPTPDPPPSRWRAPGWPCSPAAPPSRPPSPSASAGHRSRDPASFERKALIDRTFRSKLAL